MVSKCIGKCQGWEYTYLRPQSEITGFQVNPGKIGNWDGGPNIRHVVGRPDDSTVHDGNGVNLSCPCPLGELLVQNKEEADDGNSKREANQDLAVLTIRSPDTAGSNSAPQHGGREEGVDARALELVLRILSAHVVNLRDLEVEHADAHDGADEDGNHLSEEGMAWRDLRVVCEFQIVGEPDGMGAGDVAKRLEVVHGESIAFNEGASNKLGQHVERHFDTRHGFDDTNGNDEHSAEQETIKHDTRRRMRVPSSDGGDSETNGDNKNNQVPPLRSLGVRFHQAAVNVHGVFLDVARLAAEAVDKALEAHGDFVSVIQHSIGQGRSVDGEEEHVDDDISSAQERRRVLDIFLLVEVALVIDGLTNVVELSKMIVHTVGVDG